jgi:hypothetical protein
VFQSHWFFEDEQQAKDFATIQATFYGRKYIITQKVVAK